jgi:hypothetical protein
VNLESVDPNYIAMLLAGVAYAALGALWYSPLLFSNLWIRLSGRPMDGEGGGGGAWIALTVVASIVSAAVIGVVYEWAGGDGVVDGLLVGGILFVGIVAMEGLKSVVFYGHSWPLYGLNRAYEGLGFLAAGAIYGLLA